MDTKGLYIGIDIDENISQVCCCDTTGRTIQQVNAKYEDPYFHNNTPLSRIFENEDTAPGKLSSMLKALMDAAANQAGEDRLGVVGLCLRDHSEEKRRIWHEAFAGLGIERDRYILMGREETFAYYAFSSDPGTYARGVVLYDLDREGLTGCFLQRVTFKGMTILTENDEDAGSDAARKAGFGECSLDEAKQDICSFFKATLDKTPVSSVYLTGTAFDVAELPDEILNVLSRRGHRIFAGMNLYVKGACIGALSKAMPMADPFRSAGIYKNVKLSGGAEGIGGLSRCIVACKNRISSEIYVVEKDRGELKGRLLIGRGSNVDDSCISFDCISGERGQIQLEVLPLTQNTPDIYTIDLKPVKDPATELVRVNVTFYFYNEDKLRVTVSGYNGVCAEHTLDIDLLGTGKQTVRTRSDGVIVCEYPAAEVPYVFPVTGDDIYSQEELAKYLYENVYLTGAEGGFVNDDLFAFLRDRVGNGALADKLEGVRDNGGTLKDMLLTIFRDVNYYNPQEISIIEPVIDGFITGKRALVKYGRAEAYIKRGCFAKAVKELQEIMEMNPDSELPESFYSKVLYNAGSCYARCLMYEKAAEMFEGSYGFVKDEKTKGAALFARAISGTEPGILFMKGEWENAVQRAKDFRKEIENPGDGIGDPGERLERMEQGFIKKYS